MKMKKTEHLIVVSEEESLCLNTLANGIKLEPIVVERNAANEAQYRHLTSLILPILISEKNKILVINKFRKNITKHPNDKFPPLCFDLPGGHADRDAVSEEELKDGVISIDSIAKQAFREWTEEISGPQTFNLENLKFLGFYPFPQPESEEPVTNKEITAVFTIILTKPADSYKGQDNVGEIICQLPCMSISYRDLLQKWENRKENTEHYRFEDGLGRLLESGDLPERIAKMRLYWEKDPVTIL